MKAVASHLSTRSAPPYRTLRLLAVTAAALSLSQVAATAEMQDFHDMRNVSLGDPTRDGKIEIVIEFEDSQFSQLDWDVAKAKGKTPVICTGFWFR